ncbi:sensor protein [Vibrio lentus]|uniref:sensor protein n=1 Tax=Vibrio lentus TaxID=136468 RepID=UPI000C838615|nr:sensor protein [Vibrio lentus]PMG71882.1 sensor protein [Vibrio lentus]PMI46257.1 sensor protein [Vibrio lentus]PMI81157.1 sensor protein [Vibrio lentus]
MKKCFIFIVLLLTGCAAKPVPYSPLDVVNKKVAANVIEQVVMEQPTKFRPEGLVVTNSYLGLSEGYNSKVVAVGNYSDASNLVVLSANVKLSDINSRYYFNSISALELYSKRDWFIIQLKNDEKRVTKRFYTRSLEKAQRFIDSMNYMQSSTKPFGVE